MIDTNPGVHPHRRALAPDHRRCRPQQRRAVVHERHRQVQQHRCDEDRSPRRRRAAEPITSALYGFGQRVSPDFPARARASSGAPRSGPRARWRRCRWAIRSAITPLQMVAAVSSVANGGEIRRAASHARRLRDGARYQVQPKVVRRTISADTAATLTTIMEGVVSDGTAKRARRSTATRGRQDRHRRRSWSTASIRIRITTRRLSGSCRRPIRCSPSSSSSIRRKRPNGITAARWRLRFSRTLLKPALRYLGVPLTVNPPSAVLVARHDASEDARRRPASASPSRSSAWSLTTRPAPCPICTA